MTADPTIINLRFQSEPKVCTDNCWCYQYNRYTCCKHCYWHTLCPAAEKNGGNKHGL